MFYSLYFEGKNSSSFEGNDLNELKKDVAAYFYYEETSKMIDRIEVEDESEAQIEIIDGSTVQEEIEEMAEEMQENDEDFLGVLEAAKEAVSGL